MTTTNYFESNGTINECGVRCVRALVNEINKNWVPDQPTRAWDRQKGKIHALAAVIRFAFAQYSSDDDAEWEYVENADGEAIGVRVPMLEYYEAECGMHAQLEERWRACKPELGDDRNEIWDEAFHMYAHLSASQGGVADWATIMPAQWDDCALRATAAATTTKEAM